MSENEKRLKDWMESAAPWSLVGPEALDALLAEHRAEVERLTAERDEWETNARTERAHRERQVADLSAKATVARDAALEETGQAMRKLWDNAMPHRKGAFADAEATIRALKSQPARQYVEAEKVREVLCRNYRFAFDNGQVFVRATVADIAEALGVDLDAEGKRQCQECMREPAVDGAFCSDACAKAFDVGLGGGTP